MEYETRTCFPVTFQNCQKYVSECKRKNSKKNNIMGNKNYFATDKEFLIFYFDNNCRHYFICMRGQNQYCSS